MFNLEKVTAESQLPIRRWLSLILSMVLFSTFALYLVLAVLLEPLNELHGWDIEILLLVYTLMMVLSSPMAIIVGKVRDTTGDRTVLLLGAVLYAIGCIVGGLTSNIVVFFIMVGVLTAAGQNAIITGIVHGIAMLFPDKPGLSLGLFYAGSGLINMALIPAAAFLASTYSSTVVLAGLGTIALVATLIVAPIFAVPPENYVPKGWTPPEDAAESTESVAGGLQVSWKRLFFLPSLYLFILAFTGTDLICEALNSNFSLVAQQMAGMDEMASAWMGSLLSFGTAIGGFVMGFLADKIGAPRSMTVTTAVVGAVVGIGLLIGVTPPVFGCIAVLVGAGLGVMTVLMPIITMEAYGEKNFGVNFGIMGIAIPIAAFIGPQLTVQIPLTLCFAICAGACLLAAVLYLLGDKSVKRFHRKHQETETAA